MKKETMWIIGIVGVVLLIGVFLYKKAQAAKNAANPANVTDEQGTSVSSVLPDTSTTSTPTADSTWNPAYRAWNQQATASQAQGIQSGMTNGVGPQLV